MNNLLNSKKNILILLFFLVIITFIGYLLTFNKRAEEKIIVPHKIKIEGGLQGNFSDKTNFEKQNYNIPKQLPTANIKLKKIDIEFVQSINKLLNFNANIETFTDVSEGEKFFLNNDTHFFIATPKLSEIKYGSITYSQSLLGGSTTMSESEIKRVANNYLDQYLSNNGFWVADNITYLKKSKHSEGFDIVNNSNEAEVYQVNFSVSGENNFQIFSSSHKTPLTYVQVYKNGEIYYLEMTAIENFIPSVNFFDLKNINEIKDTIDTASLVTIYGEYRSVVEIDIRSIKRMLINSIDVVYFWEGNIEKSLQPFFLMHADAEITGSTVNKAIFFMNAFK